MAFAILWYARSKLGSKVGSFGCNFKVQIIVDSEVIKPCRKITGSVIIETQRPIKHQGILIQFEGACTLKYPTKSEGYTTNQHGRDVILEGAGWKSAEAYFRSPIQHVLITKSELPHVISPGSISYPFSLDFPENHLHLPAPFRNVLGCLVYRLVVYMAEPIRLQMQIEIGHKIMQFNGHYNLLNDEMALTPISVEKSLKTSVFARKKLVDVHLFVEKSGFLPGETVPFSLSFKNLQCLPLHVSVLLMQHIKYNATNRRESVKRKVAILAKLERRGDHMPEGTWMDSLRIPENQVPSFTCHYMYNVAYCIQFKVKVLAEMSSVIKGEAPIYIGTTRSCVEHLRIAANNSYLPPGITRRASTNSIGSSTSIGTTTSTLPPAYSQLSSRIPSWETLPPSYDELEMPEDATDEIAFDGLTLASSVTQFDSASPDEKSST